MLRTEQAIPAWPGWETERLIGRGSFGAVYEIRREVLGHLEKAALKYIRIPQSDSELDELMNDGYDAQSITERFEGYLHDIVREYALMADMKGCGNVVYCDDVRYIQHDNGIGWDIYIKMELLTPLPKALGKEISESEIIKIGADMCNALAFCEKRNLIHRDIKPANIFMAPDGMYKLGDFGIAKTAERTTSGTKTGTYKYMAPEVYNNQPYGTKADIYSLGLVLYWLLNERRTPFLPLPPTTPTSREEDGARNRRLRGEPLPPPAHGSPALQRVVLRACSYDPRDRYRNAEELLQALKNVEANPEGSAERTGFSGVPAEGRQTWDVRSEDATEGLLFSRTSADAKATRDTGGWTQGRRDPSFEESGHYDRPVREESETVGVYNGGVAGRSAERSTAKKTTAILLACGAAAVVLVLILLLLPRGSKPATNTYTGTTASTTDTAVPSTPATNGTVEYTPTPVPAQTPAASTVYTRDGILEAAKAREASSARPAYVTVSYEDGTSLQVPNESSFLNPPKKKLVKPQRDTADSIYIMPKPEEGHGVLGTMNRNEEVTVLVEMGGYCFFVAEDGRAGWNGTKFFVDP